MGYRKAGWRGGARQQGPGRRKEEEGSGEREKAVSGMKIRYQEAGGSEVTTFSSSLLLGFAEDVFLPRVTFCYTPSFSF